MRFERAREAARVSAKPRGRAQVQVDHADRHGFPLPVILKHEAEWWRLLLSVYRELISER